MSEMKKLEFSQEFEDALSEFFIREGQKGFETPAEACVFMIDFAIRTLFSGAIKNTEMSVEIKRLLNEIVDTYEKEVFNERV